MKKVNVLILTLIVSIICSLMPPVLANDAGTEKSDYIVYEDFTDYKGGKPINLSISGDSSKYKAVTDTDTNTYMGMNTDLARIQKIFSSEISEGTIKLDYRVKFNDVSSSLNLRFATTNFTTINNANAEYTLETAYFQNGEFRYYYNSRGFSDFTKAGTYAADEWHKVSLWLDVDNKRVHYFYDDEFVGSENVNTDLDIKGFVFTFTGTDEKYAYMDDICVKMLDLEDIKAQYDLSGEVPEGYLDEIYFNINSENTGNIFFTGNKPVLNIEANNRSAEVKNAELDIEVYDYTGKKIETAKKTLEISAEGKAAFEYVPNISDYGTYEIKVSESNMGISKTADFSYAVLSKKTTPKYGTNVHMNYKRGNTDKLMPLIKNAGFSMTRDVWAQNVKSNGDHNPTYSTWFTRYYNQSIQMDVDMLACFKIDRGKGLETDEAGLSYLESYAEKFAAYYKDTIKYIELGNEWNHESKNSTPEEYWLCMKAAYKGIKKGNENAKVIGFATASIDIKFIEEVLKLCQAENFYPFDAISVHAYHNVAILEEKNNSWHRMTWVEYSKTIASLMEKYNLQDMEIWATEVGWYTNPCTVSNTVSHIEQAAYYLRVMALNDAYDLFDYMTFYDFQDDGVLLTNRDHHWGIVEGYVGEDTPYAAKPAYLAFSNYANLLGDAQYSSIQITEVSENSGKNYEVKYERSSDKADVYMLWNTVGDTTYTLPLAGKSVVRVYDAFGNSKFVQVTDSKAEINIGILPVFAEVLDVWVDATLNGKEITGEEMLNDGDFLNVDIHSNITDDFNILIAEYNQNALEKVNRPDNLSFSYTISENTDKLMIFIWDENLSPLMKAVSVGK